MDTRDPFLLPAVLSFPLAAVLAAAAIGGILLPEAYAHESALWTAQGIGQDWVDVVVVAPCLAAFAFVALRGSRVFRLLLGGTIVYTLYSLVLYAFAVHFNVLFLVYTLALGLAFYALVGTVCAFGREDVSRWFSPRAPVWLAGGVAVLLGGAFSILWLSEVIPALVAGVTPKSIQDAGLITNPVHVLDLGIVLPGFVIGGIALMRRRPLGYWLVPVLLTFGVLMDLALVGMVLSMRAQHLPAAGPPLPVFAVMTGVGLLVVSVFLRHLHGAAAPPA
jgi:hypothetical protein